MEHLERSVGVPGPQELAPVSTSRRRLRLRPIVIALVMAAAVASRRGGEVDTRAPNRSTALAEVLRARGLSCTQDDVAWLDGAGGVRGALLGGARALVRANLRDEPSDLYLVDVRLSPEGVLLDVGSASNVTHTIGVDENRPILRGSTAAYTTSLDTSITGVHTLDLSGRAPATYTDFTRLQRWQTALTNVQQTGQPSGVVHNAFALDPTATNATLRWREDGLLDVVADDRRILLDPGTGKAVEGGGWVREVPEERARPGNLVTWSVDRVRAMPWFGDDNMQWLKAIAFTALDWGLRARAMLVKDTSEREVAEDLGGANVAQAKAPMFTDPEIGWPPAPMKPILSPPLPGEGQWISLDNDPFVSQPPGHASPFVTSYLRSDRDRRDTRIYVTMWDPRQIALHMVAGTVEPVSATGEAGPGVIPRAPEVMKRVVAGFNGGFQAMHGEYGMQADGVLYLPPKPFAATVLELRDGTTAFGAWPRSTDVPDEVLSFRQNLTAIVQNDRFNPWGRGWWGGTPPGWAGDTIHTTRSGICLTKDNFVGYFFGNEISPDVLAAAMLAARCAFAVHLDMNPGLVGFEFYNVQPTTSFTPLARPLQADWEYQGALRDFAGFSVRARRMIRSMSEINFPQYIHREGRDFFYLTVRPSLPGPELALSAPAPASPGEGIWRVKGLPQHGFPYAIATTSLRIDPARPALHARVLRVDPRVVRAAGSAGTTETTPTVVSLFTNLRPPRTSEMGLWFHNGVFLPSVQSPATDATLLVVGEPLAHAAADSARVAVGIHDEDGMLEWVELAPDASADAATARAMDALLARDGCATRLLVEGAARALLGGSLDLEGASTTTPAGTSARLVRGQAPAARPYFESTPIVGPPVWQPLQMQRVRYFPKPKAAPSSAAGTAASASPPPPAAPAASSAAP
jgi:hypothetical protein